MAPPRKGELSPEEKDLLGVIAKGEPGPALVARSPRALGSAHRPALLRASAAPCGCSPPAGEGRAASPCARLRGAGSGWALLCWATSRRVYVGVTRVRRLG